MGKDIQAGRASVKLLLKKRGFIKGLAGAGRKLAAFAKGAAIAGAAIAAVGIAGAAVAVRSFIKLGDTLDKMSARTGVTVERFSELKHAAEISGTSLEVVEKGVLKMQKSLVDAQAGLSTSVDAFEDLGLSIEDLSGLTPDEQFDRVGKAIAGVEDPSRRAGLAMNLLGKSGAKLTPMFASMDQLRQEAQDLGFVMTTEMASSAARVTDMFSKLWTTMKQAAVVVGAAIAPFLEVALPAIQSFATSGLKSMGTVTEFMKSAWGSVVEFVVPIIATLQATFDGAFDAIGGTVSTVFTFVADTIGAAMDFLQTTILTVLQAVSFAWENWGLLLDVAIVSAEFGVVRFANQVVHFFTEVIPSVLTFFFENWRDIFTDIFNITKTVMTNIIVNILNVWDGIVGIFQGKGLSQFKWQPLTQGFESALKEWPKIAEREIGPLEKTLSNELGGLRDELDKEWEDQGREFAAKVAEFTPVAATVAAAKEGADQTIAAKDQGGEATVSAGEIKKNVFTTFSLAALSAQGGGSPQDKVRKSVDDAAEKQKKRDSKLLKAVEKGGTVGN